MASSLVSDMWGATGCVSGTMTCALHAVYSLLASLVFPPSLQPGEYLFHTLSFHSAVLCMCNDRCLEEGCIWVAGHGDLLSAEIFALLFCEF